MKFDIDNVELIEEDHESSFALLSLDFFSDGDNLHDLYVSTETLMRTADTIKGCPVLWEYDKYHDDIGTHDNTTICGFIPEVSQITSRKINDGRTMLNVVARVWKIYSGQLLEFFKRDGNKPVSVEMSVFDIEERDGKIDELKDYKFEGVAILGSKVTPAIELSNSEVIRFEKEYQIAYHREFAKYDGFDFSIPWDVRENASLGLELYKEYSRGGNSLSRTVGRALSQKDEITPKKIKHIDKIFSGKRFDNRNKEEISNSYINFMLYGGEECKIWAKDICDQLEEIDNQNTSYFEQLLTFPYKSLKDINPALKGIKPPITLSQANEIARQADAIGADKGGWGIAIKHFKDTHIVKDGRWVKKQEYEHLPREEENSMTDKIKKEDEVKLEKDLLEDTSPEEEEEVQEEEMAKEDKKEEEDPPKKEDEMAKEEDDEEDKEESEDEESEEEEMSISLSADMIKILLSIFKEDENYSIIQDEFSKEEKDYPRISELMYGKMVEMSKYIELQNSTNEELSKFKKDVEQTEFDSEVKIILKQIDDIVDIPVEALEEMRSQSLEFDSSNIKEWEVICKAKAFSFPKKEKGDGSNIYATAWLDGVSVISGDVWDRLK